MRLKRIILIVAAVVAVAALGVAWFVYSRLGAVYDGEKVRIYVPAGVTERSLQDTLVSRLGDFGEDVYFAWRMQRPVVGRAHGSYVIDPGDKALSVSRRLKIGNQSPVKLTFNNIRTLDQLADHLASRMEWGAGDFKAACDSVLPPKGFKTQEYPAAFIPDTYEFFWTASAVDVVKKLSDIRDDFWSDERRAAAAALGLTPVKTATLASIVEEETAKADERPLVARLYLNRLDRGMLLQADPTVKFAVGDFSLRRILGKHLAVESPYNTYKNAGLPPGPIRIVERSTLDAVLNAPRHSYIYMCAKDDFSGYHNFASDLSTHNANAARYHRALSHRNIR